MTIEEIDKRFTYHPPTDDKQRKRYTEMRAKARDLAVWIAQNTPDSREQSVAITNLEQTVHWANAAIARNEKPRE